MRKQIPRPKAKTLTAGGRRSPGAVTRAPREAGAAAARPAPGGAASDPMRLGEEVERLRAELAAMRAKLAELELRAEIDPLTGVFNRSGFERELRRAAAHVGRYGAHATLLYIDLDRFKSINDRYGHAAGDALLRAIAATLLHSVRASDTIGRLGGDEFALLLWHLDEAAALAKAAALEAAIAEARIEWEKAALGVGASVGVASLGADDDGASALARADAAMYQRKAARRN